MDDQMSQGLDSRAKGYTGMLQEINDLTSHLYEYMKDLYTKVSW